MNYSIVPMRISDEKWVARLHREGIPQGFLSKLNHRFLSRLYAGIAHSPESGVWVAIDSEDQIVGFVSGTKDVKRCYRAVLKRHGAALIFNLIPALVSPVAWRYCFETLTYPMHEREKSENVLPEPTAELLSLVVSPHTRGAGIATRLCETLEENLQAWGHNGEYRVVTMASDPRSNAFYSKFGFELIREFTHHRIAMALYHKAV